MIRKTIQGSENQIWCGDFNQTIFGSTLNDSGFNSILGMDMNQSGVNRFHFDTNFRNSIAIAQLAKCFISLMLILIKKKILKKNK
jgi:hypothetical protein